MKKEAEASKKARIIRKKRDYWVLQPVGVNILIRPDHGLPYLLPDNKPVAKTADLDIAIKIAADFGWKSELS